MNRAPLPATARAALPAASPGRFVSGTRFPIEDGDASLAPIPPGESYVALYALTPVPGAKDGSRQLQLKARQIRRWLAQRLRRHGHGHAQQVQATALPEPVACRHADEAQVLQ